MQPFALRYPEVEALLSELHGVAPTGRVALMGRIKNLQRKGWPPGTNSGRGKPAEYDGEAVIKLLLAFEMGALRIPPDQVVDWLRALNWHEIGEHLARVANELAQGLKDNTVQMKRAKEKGALLIFDPDGLDTLRDGKPLRDPTLTQPPWIACDDEERMAALSDLFHMGRRFSAINLTKLVIQSALALEKIGGPSGEKFGEGILAWLEPKA